MTWNYICESWAVVAVSRGRKPQKQIAVLLAQPLFLFKNNHRVEKSQCGKSPHRILFVKNSICWCAEEKKNELSTSTFNYNVFETSKKANERLCLVCSLCLYSVKKKTVTCTLRLCLFDVQCENGVERTKIRIDCKLNPFNANFCDAMWNNYVSYCC